MKPFLLHACLILLSLGAAWDRNAQGQQPPAPSPAERLQQADRLRQEGSFRLAREAYEGILEGKGQVAPEVRTAAQVWAADTLWRERTGGDTMARAEKGLGRLVEDLAEDSRWRAEAAESLGDLRLETRPWDTKDSPLEAWLKALKYWSQATDLSLARPRYTALNFKLADYIINRRGGVVPFPDEPGIVQIDILPPPPPKARPWEGELATWCLRNVLRVSQDPAERGRALYLLGHQMAGVRTGKEEVDRQRDKEAEDYFKQAIAVRPPSEWTGKAYAELGQFYANHNRYVEAARTFEQFLKLYQKGESPQWDEVNNQYNNITQPGTSLWLNRAFAPHSFVHLTISYRNVGQASLRITRVRPEDYVEAQRASTENRLDLTDKLKGELVREIKVEGVANEGKYEPHQKDVYLEPMKPGLYLAELIAPKVKPEERQRGVFLVSSLAAAAKHGDGRSEVFVSEAESGTPVKGARLWMLRKNMNRPYGNPPQPGKVTEGRTGESGIGALEYPKPTKEEQGSWRTLVMAEKDGQVALVEGWQGYYGNREMPAGQAVLYAYSDRPAYRPNEPIHWKAILRFTEGKEYKLPTMATVYAVIRDARDQVAWEGEQKIGAYGSFEGTFSVDRKAALGVMNLALYEHKGVTNPFASAQLCRLEEYKLPEYKVAVEPGKEQVRFGQAVPFEIRAEYYFGGPVAGAEVEVVIRRSAFWPHWEPLRPYPWLYEGDQFSGRRSWGMMDWHPYEPEQIVLTKKLKTDAKGDAHVEVGALSAEEIKLAADKKIWGYQYSVEARVVDPSRREVHESGSVKVGRTAFAAYLTPQRFLYLPGDKVKVDIRTLDPNERPVAAEAFVTIYKREWSKERKNDKGEPEPGYIDTKLFARPVLTDAKSGATVLEFEPSEAGYYFLRYETQDRFGEKVTGETTVCVAKNDTTQIGFRSGGVTIITDKDTYERGETAHVLLAVRRPGAAVWFGVEGEAQHLSQVVRTEGTVKMVEVPITQDLEPNIFFTAVSMFDYAGFRDTKRIVVPPKRRFLNVTLRSEKTEYRPGEKAKVEVEVKDDRGQPVQTELSLGVADAAVWAIQGDLAEDIRKAFWSRLRYLAVQTEASAERYGIERWRPKKDKPGEYELIPSGEVGEGGQKDEKRAYSPIEGGPSMGDVWRVKGDAMMENAPASAPMPAAAPMAGVAMRSVKMASVDALAKAKGGEESNAPARLRTNFSATALWLPSLVTGADGRATTEVTFPDSLTSWKMTARAADKETRVGEVRIETKTNKPLMVRPQGPRFFIQGDEVTLSAIVNNNTSATLRVEVGIDPQGLKLTKFDASETSVAAGAAMTASTEPVPASEPRLTILVPAQNQRRVDWRVVAGAPGQARIKTEALSAVDSDAAEKTFPIYEYGIEQYLAGGATIREKEASVEKTITLEMPAERRAGSEALTIWIEPTLARTMVTALDYLADYPYGCVEQTLSRFVPSVITARTLQQLGIRRPELEKKLPDMINAGLTRLYDFQHADGGWGWWQEGESEPFMTAYVIQGLAQAREADVQVKADVIERGARFLQTELVKLEKEPDQAAFVLYALASLKDGSAKGEFADKAFDRLWAAREKLNPYTRALFALSCHGTGRAEWERVLVRNMNNGLIEDRQNGTAHWGESGIFYRWSQGGIEGTAFSLRALLAIDPKSATIDPAMTWLVRNRRGSQWSNTRDTAIAIGALADYITLRKEDKPDWTAEVRVNGELVKTLRAEPGKVFEFEGKIEVPAAKLRTGKNTITIRRQGTGVLYASAGLSYFTRQKEIKPAGNEVFVQRRYFRTRQEPTLAGVYKTVREELRPGQRLVSGERVEVELSLEAKNDYEYLVIEDLKAAGLEPTEVQSGFAWGEGLAAHRELRDEKTAFFVSNMAEGKHTLKYELRAEVPGVFHALPALVHTMYIPEIRANSAGATVKIVDQAKP